ncbi:hypothetical protein Peetri_00090 [Pseudomonas phage vB_PpuM-Peetri]
MTIALSKFVVTTPMTAKVVKGKNIALTVKGDEACSRCAEFISVNADEELDLFAPTHGAATESVHRTRTELMEEDYWALDSAAHHWLRMAMTVKCVNQGGRVVIAQCHVKNSNNPMIKIFWDKGAIKIGFRRKESDEPVTTTVRKGVKEGDRLALALHLTKAGSVSLNVSSNGQKDNFTEKLDPSWQDFTLNFHAGLYNQLDYSDKIPTTDCSRATIHTLGVDHDAA